MQDKVTNKSLVLIVIFVLLLTTFSNFFLLYSFSSITKQNIITGKLPGNVTLIIVDNTPLSIKLNIDQIDFGSGYVNTSKPECANYANLTAAEKYYDINDCWTDDTTTPRPLLLENTGGKNVTIFVSGPNSSSFFRGYAGSNKAEILWRIRNNETDACTIIPSGVDVFNQFSKNPELMCDNLKFIPDGEDEIAIDFRIIIPSDLSSGVYENTSIEFTATAS